MTRRRKPGRPRVGRLVRRGLFVSFRVRADEAALLQLRAEEAGLSVSGLARRTLLAPDWPGVHAGREG